MDATLGWLALAAGRPRTDPVTHQSESGNGRSAYGTVFRALVARGGQDNRAYGRVWEQGADHPAIGHDAVGNVVREQVPLVRLPFGQRSFTDFVGAFVARPATIRPVIALGGYQGQLPMTEQSKLIKPKPWSDPTRGEA